MFQLRGNGAAWFGLVCYFMIQHIQERVSTTSRTLTGWAGPYFAIILVATRIDARKRNTSQDSLVFLSFFMQTLLQCLLAGSVWRRETFNVHLDEMKLQKWCLCLVLVVSSDFFPNQRTLLCYASSSTLTVPDYCPMDLQRKGGSLMDQYESAVWVAFEIGNRK